VDSRLLEDEEAQAGEGHKRTQAPAITADATGQTRSDGCATPDPARGSGPPVPFPSLLEHRPAGLAEIGLRCELQT
jgi:hypothetical protein